MYAGDMSIATALIFAPEQRSRFQNDRRASGPFAVPHEQHRPAIEVQHDTQVAMPPANRDFVDGDSPDPFQLRPEEVLLQMPFLDVFDHIPADPPVCGDLPNGHGP